MTTEHEHSATGTVSLSGTMNPMILDVTTLLEDGVGEPRGMPAYKQVGVIGNQGNQSSEYVQVPALLLFGGLDLTGNIFDDCFLLAPSC